MRQAWRVIAGLLAVGVVAAGGSVALADSGNHGGRDNHGNRGNTLATTIFTMGVEDGNPEGVAVDKRSGRFFVSRAGAGAVFVGTLRSPPLQPVLARPGAGNGPPANGLKGRHRPVS